MRADGRTDGQTDRQTDRPRVGHDKANSRFSQFSKSTHKEKVISYNLVQCLERLSDVTLLTRNQLQGVSQSFALPHLGTSDVPNKHPFEITNYYSSSGD